MAEWIAYNVDLITTIPEDYLNKVNDVIYEGFMSGKTTTRMARDVMSIYGVSKRRAKFIARDQTAKLNGQIQMAQQLDAGITKYTWYTTGDERVRDSHRALNGKQFSWDDAPLNSDGRKCHPGEDYGCRCIGSPVFDIETINLPIADDDVQITIK
jgi:SPP1 gp7 family putative phage head morphogenesis protein